MDTPKLQLGDSAEAQKAGPPGSSNGYLFWSEIFSKSPIYSWAAATLICLLGGWLRWLNGSTEFWMDEIWTWQLSQLAQSPWDVLKIKHDNNHLLNTLVFYLLGPDQPAMIYRWPTIACGTLAIPTMGAIFWKRDRGCALLLMLLVATNHMLIHYGSEARGYGYLILATASAIWLADRSMAKRAPINDLGFALACVFGFASHSTFVFCFLAIGIWFLHRVGTDPHFRTFALGSLIRCSLIPMIFVAWVYLSFTSQMKIGGGVGTSFIAAVFNLLTSTFGGDAGGWWQLQWVGMTSMFLVASTMLYLYRKQPNWAVLSLAGLVIAPMLVILLMRPPLIYARYFLVQTLFLLIVASLGLHVMARTRSRYSLVSLTMLTVVVCGNLLASQSLVKLGRGHYREAILLMLQEEQHKPAETLPHHAVLPEILVGGDYDGRHKMILAFFQRQLDPEQRIRYVSQEETTERGFDWMVLHHGDANHHPEQVTIDAHGHRYALRRAYPYGGASGWKLYLYQREHAFWKSANKPRHPTAITPIR